MAYEPDATDRLNLFANLNYNYGKLNTSVRLDYYTYSTKTFNEAWHRPAFISNISLGYQFNKELNLQTTLSALGGVKALSPEENTSVELDPIVDLSLAGYYQINEKFTGFIELNNVLGKKYERYLNYLNRSFMGHLGVTYKF